MAATATRSLFIGGEWRGPAGEGSYERVDPSSGESLGAFAAAGVDDVDAAVAAADRAYRTGVWRDLPGAEKQAALRRIADWLREHQTDLTEDVSSQTGKPSSWAAFDVVFAADYFDYYSGLVRDVSGRTLPQLRPDLFAYTLKEGARVAGIITPWNFPLLIAAQKVAPRARCWLQRRSQTVTVDSAECHLRSVAPFTRRKSRGCPNVLTEADGAIAIGDALVRHPNVRVVSFTGSSGTGAKVMAAGAGTLKRVVIEAGGKCPMIILSDADLDAALDAALFAVFFNTGQVCNAASRLILHDAIADSFQERFVTEAQKIRVGHPRDPDTQLGPVVSDVHLERVLDYIDAGGAEGAEVLLRGERLESEPLRRGYYLSPTVFGGVHSGMRMGREEIFGPVVGITRYSELEQAISEANATPFGLAGAIWSRDVDVIAAATRGLEVGMAWVNEFLAVFAETPHGGYGTSGIGREMGPEAIQEFQETKCVVQKHGARQAIWI